MRFEVLRSVIHHNVMGASRQVFSFLLPLDYAPLPHPRYCSQALRCHDHEYDKEEMTTPSSSHLSKSGSVASIERQVQ